MTERSPGEIMRSWFELVWNEGRLDLVPELLGPETVIHQLDETGTHGVGPAGFIPFYQRLKGACPDLRFTIHEVVADETLAAGRWAATATHTGDHLGPPATGNRVSLTGMSLIRVKNGKVSEAWNEWDRLAMAMAIGAVSAAQPA